MDLHELESDRIAFSQAKERATELADLSSFTISEVKAAILQQRRRGISDPIQYMAAKLEYVDQHARVDQGLREKCRGVGQEDQGITAELDRLRSGPWPLPGSQAYSQLAATVARHEKRLDVIRIVQRGLNYFLNYPHEAFIQRAREGRRRLAQALVELAADESVQRLQAAIHQARAGATQVLNEHGRLRAFIRGIAQRADAEIAVPDLEFEVEAFKAVSRGPSARIVMQAAEEQTA